MILPVGRDGDGSALVVFLASIRCSVWGHSDPHAGRIDVHIAPDVGATSFGSPPVANRAHRRSNFGRSARGRSRGAITRLDVGKGYFGNRAMPAEFRRLRTACSASAPADGPTTTSTMLPGSLIGIVCRTKTTSSPFLTRVSIYGLSLERSPSIINRTSLSCEYASCFEVKQTNIG